VPLLKWAILREMCLYANTPRLLRPNGLSGGGSGQMGAAGRGMQGWAGIQGKIQTNLIFLNFKDESASRLIVDFGVLNDNLIK
jgi:hypothetical protein